MPATTIAPAGEEQVAGPVDTRGPAHLAPPSRVHALERFGPAAAVLVVALALFPWYRYGVALDGLAYLSIAQSYASGDLSAALNAYWSPLYSWLHVPLLAIGVDPLDASTVLAAFIAAATVLALGAAIRLVASSRAAALASLAASPLVLAAAHYGIFADLLLSSLLLAFLANLLHPRFPTDTRRAALAGLFAGLAYLAKLYALPLVVAVAPVALVLHALFRPARWRDVLRTAPAFVGVFLLISVPWMVALSLHEGGPTVGSSAGHNLELVAPGSEGNPIRYGGLQEPQRDGAFSAWEDPTSMPVDAESWTESERVALQRVVDNLERNRTEWWGQLTRQGTALLVAGALGAAAWVWRRPRRPVVGLGLLAAGGAYTVGYLFTWVEPRYAWFLLLLLVVPAGVLLDRSAASRAGWWGALAVAAGIFAWLLPPSLDELALKWNSGRELDGILADVERQGLVEEGHVVASADNWQRSAILCFRLGCEYLGHPLGETWPEQRAELREAGVDRYLVWFPGSEGPTREPLVDPDQLGDLRVYDVEGAAADVGSGEA